MTMDRLDERLGAGSGRSDGSAWTDLGVGGFVRSLESDRLLLDLPQGVSDAWVRRPFSVAADEVLMAEFRVRCDSRLRGPSLVLGVRFADGTDVLVRQGGMTRPWNDIGPYGDDRAGVIVPALEPADWHTWSLRLERGSDLVRLELDDRDVMVVRLGAPVGSVGEGMLVIGSERPGQRIELARAWAAGHRRPIRTARLSSSLEADWTLDGAIRAPHRVRREARNPIVAPGRPGWPEGQATYDAWVARDGESFRMWYVARTGGPGSPLGIHHARSADGVAWAPDGAEPVFTGGRWGAWDAGGVQGPVVLPAGRGWRMWYAGYLPGHREARVCVVDSADGLSWEPVRVGSFSFRGSTENNIAYDLGDGPDDCQYVMPQCVVDDPGAPAERRYTLFVHAQGQAPIIGVARSADGLTFVRDHAAERHHAIASERPEVGRLHQRTAVVREDDLWTAFFGYIAPGPRITLHTYAATWRVEAGEDPGSFGLWQATRQLIPVRGTWESGFTWPSSVVSGRDGWRLFYTGSIEAFDGSVGLATLAPGALHGIRPASPRASATLVSRPLGRPDGGWHGRRILVRSQGSGSLRVSLADVQGVPIPGRSLDDSVSTPAGRSVATWVDGDTLPADASAPLVIHVVLDGRRTLYSLEIMPTGVTP